MNVTRDRQARRQSGIQAIAQRRGLGGEEALRGGEVRGPERHIRGTQGSVVAEDDESDGAGEENLFVGAAQGAGQEESFGTTSGSAAESECGAASYGRGRSRVVRAHTPESAARG